MTLAQWIAPLALLGLLADARADDDEKKPKGQELPRAVARAVKKAFPGAEIVGVSKGEDEEGEAVFEVEMALDGMTIDVKVDEEGEIEEVERQIEPEDLPRAVLKAARAKFPRAEIAKVEEVTDEDGKVVYEVAFRSKAKGPFEVVMSPNGKILESEDEEDDEGEADKKDKDGEEEGEKAEVKKKAKGKAKAKAKEEMEEGEAEADGVKARAGKKAKAEKPKG